MTLDVRSRPYAPGVTICVYIYIYVVGLYDLLKTT